MTSNPIFSTKQLHAIIGMGTILGLYLVGLGIGELIQMNNLQSIAFPFYIASGSMFLIALYIVVATKIE